MAALRRTTAALIRTERIHARSDTRTWMQARRARTRRLIELGGLIHKSGLADRLGDDRAAIMGALMLAAEMLTTADAKRAPAEIIALWRAVGRAALKTSDPTNTEPLP